MLVLVVLALAVGIMLRLLSIRNSVFPSRVGTLMCAIGTFPARVSRLTSAVALYRYLLVGVIKVSLLPPMVVSSLGVMLALLVLEWVLVEWVCSVPVDALVSGLHLFIATVVPLPTLTISTSILLRVAQLFLVSDYLMRRPV